jgi:predicted TIM-barrel fold metal-dependent hydrolase
MMNIEPNEASKIIDSHTHIGNIPFVVGKNRVNKLDGEDLIFAMEKYRIDFALVSGLEGSEFDANGKLAQKDYQISQKIGIDRMIKFVRGNSTKVKALFWAKPFTEGLTPEVEKTIADNLNVFCGLKLHPSLSGMKLTDKRFYPYLELAVKLNFPVQIHTENDGYSDVRFVEKISSIFPELKFVMVHMGMNSDNSEAIKLIRKNDNIFGDTCVVPHNNVITALRECGSGKILFGTDAVVRGIDTYSEYIVLSEKIKVLFTKKEASDVLSGNCMRLYNLS